MYQRKDDEGVQSPDAGHLWPVPGLTTHSTKRLKVLILGPDHQDHFQSILAANVQQWGYEASVLPHSVEAGEGEQRAEEIEGDVLLYDLDVPLRRTTLPASGTGEDESHTGPYLVGSDKRWPRVRLMIALSSRSVSRFTLEQIGAVALLYKPFQMGRLQRYLQVFQQVLFDESGSGGGDTSSRSPLARRAAGEGAHQGPDHAARILVVEDHPRVAETIRQCLECEPRYDIRVAKDGLNALEQCVTWRPHCIVTDLLLPYMDGYQVMRTLSATPGRERPAFVVLSALTQHELPESHVYPQGNSVVFIDKPFQIENLLDAVEQVLAS
jgi:CheY-like chemotaxis protein